MSLTQGHTLGGGPSHIGACWPLQVPNPLPTSSPRPPPDILKSPLIIFMMGGPACGKGTQCKNMATKYGLCHVGLGQLLRQEAQRSTRWGRKIHDLMLQGLLVPTVRAHRLQGAEGRRRGT